MMKIVYTEKYLMRVATGLLREALLKVPAVVIEAIEHEGRLPDRTMVDIVIRIRYANRPYTLLGEVKTNGQPRHARLMSLILREWATRMGPGTIPVFIAPYLSPESRSICEKYDVGFLDLMGNMRIVFDAVFIDRAVADKPVTERRSLRSVFSPGPHRSSASCCAIPHAHGAFRIWPLPPP